MRWRTALMVVAGVALCTGAVVALWAGFTERTETQLVMPEVESLPSSMPVGGDTPEPSVTATPTPDPTPDATPSEPPESDEPDGEDTEEPQGESTGEGSGLDPDTPASPPAADDADYDVLRERLDDVFANVENLPDTDRLAISILDDAGQEVYGLQQDAAFVPASTQKLITAAAALSALGPDYQFTTVVEASEEPDDAGVVDGDLILIGSGDPALSSPNFETEVNTERPHTSLQGLVDQLEDAGVTEVTGGVVADTSAWPHEPEPAGWPERYFQGGDGTRSAALTIDAGRRIWEANGALQSAPAEDPAAEAAERLHELLDDAEIDVSSEPAVAEGSTSAGTELASVQSPELTELLEYTVQRSDNHLADALFRAVGAAHGDGSWEHSADVTIDALETLGLDWSEAVLADGSGLSRDDRLTADFLAQLDMRMRVSNFGQEWAQAMAVTGETGTLRQRLSGSVAHGQVFAKTGWLSDVRSLSGHIIGPEEETLSFAMIGNGLEGEQDEAVRNLQDEVLLAVTEHLFGCVRVPDPEATPSDEDGEEGETTDGETEESSPTPTELPSPDPAVALLDGYVLTCDDVPDEDVEDQDDAVDEDIEEPDVMDENEPSADES